MKKILVVESSPRGKISITRALTSEILKTLKAANPDAHVIVRDLDSPQTPHLTSAQTTAILIPSENRTALDQEALHYSDELVKEVLDADIIVIGAPMYSFSIPSNLKVWLDLISRPRVTFQYTPEGPVGLVKGKKVYLAVATGGVYSQEPQKAYDFLVPYLSTVLEFMGMADITTIRVEGVALPEFQREKALELALQKAKLS